MPFYYGTPTGTQSGASGDASARDAQALAAIRAEGSVYFKAFSMVPEAFAAAAAKEFDTMKTQSTIREGMSDYAYLQALVRQSGLSKGVGPLNQVDPDDLKAIKDVYQSAYLSGVDWQTWLDRYAQSPYASSNTGPKFSKQVSTALQLIDSTDAESILSKAYYEAYNKMPDNKQIESFKTKFKAEAQRQLAKTTTSGTTSGAGTGSTSGTSNTVTSGLGFTQAEQDQFIAGFLKDNYKITGEEEGGRVKTIIDDVKRVYRDNLLPEPPLEEIISFAADAIGTGDDTMYKQKIDTKLAGVRNAAAQLYPGLAEQLAAGTDIRTVAQPAAQALSTYLGTQIAFNDKRINQVLNYNDGKTVRTMNAAELQKFAESQPEFDTSPAGRERAVNMADAFEKGFK
jgi:hypothetical protein